VVAEESGDRYLPVRPHSRFAEANALEDWAGTEAHAIDVDDFSLAWTKKLDEDGMTGGCLPHSRREGTAVSSARLRHDFERELEQFGG
jgi:Protein of unknown function (DUF2750)